MCIGCRVNMWTNNNLISWSVVRLWSAFVFIQSCDREATAQMRICQNSERNSVMKFLRQPIKMREPIVIAALWNLQLEMVFICRSKSTVQKRVSPVVFLSASCSTYFKEWISLMREHLKTFSKHALTVSKPNPTVDGVTVLCQYHYLQNKISSSLRFLKIFWKT